MGPGKSGLINEVIPPGQTFTENYAGIFRFRFVKIIIICHLEVIAQILAIWTMDWCCGWWSLTTEKWQALFCKIRHIWWILDCTSAESLCKASWILWEYWSKYKILSHNPKLHFVRQVTLQMQWWTSQEAYPEFSILLEILVQNYLPKCCNSTRQIPPYLVLEF